VVSIPHAASGGTTVEEWRERIGRGEGMVFVSLVRLGEVDLSPVDVIALFAKMSTGDGECVGARDYVVEVGSVVLRSDPRACLPLLHDEVLDRRGFGLELVLWLPEVASEEVRAAALACSELNATPSWGRDSVEDFRLLREAALLKLTGRPDHAASLRAFLESDQDSVPLWRVLNVIGLVGEPAAALAGATAQFLGNASQDVRDAAARALAGLGGPRDAKTKKRLLTGLKDARGNARIYYIRALSTVFPPDEETTAGIAAFLLDPALAEEVLLALARFGTRAGRYADFVFHEALRSAKHGTRGRTAVLTLAAIAPNEKTVRRCVRLMTAVPEVAPTAAKAIGMIGLKDSLAIRALKEGTKPRYAEDFRRECLEALKTLGVPRDLEAGEKR
jgi:HEAT repeat protein